MKKFSKIKFSFMVYDKDHFLLYQPRKMKKLYNFKTVTKCVDSYENLRKTILFKIPVAPIFRDDHSISFAKTSETIDMFHRKGRKLTCADIIHNESYIGLKDRRYTYQFCYIVNKYVPRKYFSKKVQKLIAKHYD